MKYIFLLAFLSITPFKKDFSQVVTMGYQNPVIPGFHPDPSVCRVGNDFYLVNSSFEYFPGIPVFHSTDLIHWKQIGYCLIHKSQLDLTGIPASGGIYAPTIRYHDGTYFVIVTNVNHGGNFFVTAKDPAGEWSDPVWIDRGGIDPSLFFDDDGKVYYCGTPAWGDNKQGIYQFEIDIKTGQKITQPRLIWTGTGGRYPEGPHLYKIRGMYFLMIAEGGTEYGHMETIARSSSPWGPFESYPHNPILTHRNSNAQINMIQGTGHADLVQAADGSWWMVFLAFRNTAGQWHHLGRETFLAPVTWTTDNWPVVNGNGTVNIDMNVPTLAQKDDTGNSMIKYNFDGPKLSYDWNYLRNPDFSDYSFTEKPGWLRLTGNQYSIDSSASPAFIGRRQEDYHCTIKTRMNFSPDASGQKAGFTVMMNNDFHYDLVLRRNPDGTNHLILEYDVDKIHSVASDIEMKNTDLWLKMTADPVNYHFSYSTDGKTYSDLGMAPTRLLSSEVAGGFTGVYFGIYAVCPDQGHRVPAYFDWFEYDPN